MFVCVQDPNQRSIMEMFQRSFSADDDLDEAILMEAANDWEDDAPAWEQAHWIPHQKHWHSKPQQKQPKYYFNREFKQIKNI